MVFAPVGFAGEAALVIDDVHLKGSLSSMLCHSHAEVPLVSPCPLVLLT